MIFLLIYDVKAFYYIIILGPFSFIVHRWADSDQDRQIQWLNPNNNSGGPKVDMKCGLRTVVVLISLFVSFHKFVVYFFEPTNLVFGTNYNGVGFSSTAIQTF